MFGRKTRLIKELQQELASTRLARDYYATRFAEVSSRLQGRDSKGRFLRRPYRPVTKADSQLSN